MNNKNKKDELDEVKTFNKIFLIGNGYDLSRGMKTGYKDFLKWYLMDNLQKALESGKLHYKDDCFELKVHKSYANPKKHEEVHAFLVKAIEEKQLKETLSKSAKDDYRHSFVIYILPKNKFVRDILSDCFDAEWNGIESSLYDNIKRLHYSLRYDNSGGEKRNINIKNSILYKDSREEIKSINASLECLKRKLNEYLGHQKPKSDKDNFFSRLIESTFTDRSIDTKEVLFLNFNYTHDYRSLLQILRQRHGKITISKIQIHGGICEKNLLGNDMVFGIGDEQEELYHEIESLYDDDWLHCMKSFHYFKNDGYQKLLGFIEKGDYEIFVIGHSCSITDRTLLSMMFEHEHCKKIHVCHYQELPSYRKTTYNIARNFKDKVKMRQVVQPFNKSLKM